MIGDPTGRSETRPTLNREEIERNMKTYQEQVFQILDQNRTELLYNRVGLEQFSGTDMIKLGSKYTVQQLLEEEVIKYSTEQGLPIIDILRLTGRAKSNSEARRLIEQDGVRLDGEVVRDLNYSVSPKDGQVVQVGKRYFRKLRYEKSWSLWTAL